MSAPQLVVFVAFSDEFKRVRSSMTNKDVLSSKKIRGELGGVLVDLVQTGIGPKAASKVAQDTFSEIKYKGCIVFGYCGGLSPRLHVNDAVIANKVISDQPSDDHINFDSKLNSDLGKALVAEGVMYKCVPLITKPMIIETQGERLELFNTTKAEAVDMEAYEIVKQARVKKIPTFVLKTVIDDIHIDLPELNTYFASKKATDKSIKKGLDEVLKAGTPQTKAFTKNMKSGGDVLQKIAPLVTSFVECYWSQCQ